MSLSLSLLVLFEIELTHILSLLLVLKIIIFCQITHDFIGPLNLQSCTILL